jgi:SOS-response transcriptional repressor LexA
MENKTFGMRLKAIRLYYNLSISQMAMTMKVVKSNISRYERDRVKPTIVFLERLIKIYRVNLNWLFGESEQMLIDFKMKNKLNKKITEVVDNSPISYLSMGIPVYDKIMLNKENTIQISGAISAGEPLEIIQSDNYEYVPFPFDYDLKSLENYLVFRVNGLSMAPEIAHNDIVYIKRNTDWLLLNKKIVAVMIRGEVTLKKMSINEVKKEVVFKPLNKDYSNISISSISFDMMDNTFLIGELIAIKKS